MVRFSVQVVYFASGGVGTNLKVGGAHVWHHDRRVLPPLSSGVKRAGKIVERLRNDLYCVEWGVKLYSLTHPCTFLALQIQLVVLVSVFVMVSTVWSISCLLFFYSRCPRAQISEYNSPSLAKDPPPAPFHSFLLSSSL